MKIDPEQLADNTVATLDALVDELDLDDADAPTGPIGIGPDMALNMLRPMIYKWAEANPETAVATLARISLETEALVDEHTDADADRETRL